MILTCDEFKETFNKLGVSNENEMKEILSVLDQIAEIGYSWYKNNKIKKQISR